MVHYISHIQSPLSKQDFDLFIRALTTKGEEATAFIWIQWWFDFKKQNEGRIKAEYLNEIAEAIDKNSPRIFKQVKH